MMVAESNEPNYFEKKRDCTEEEEEIAGLVAGLSPPMAKEICKFFDELRPAQTERETRKVNKIVTEYIKRSISLKETFEQFYLILSSDNYGALVKNLSTTQIGEETLKTNGITVIEIKATQEIASNRKRTLRSSTMEVTQQASTKKRKRAEKDIDEPFVQGNEFSRSRAKKISWTEEENQKLCQIVKEEGTYSWKRIAALLNTGKTASQCNQHWKRVLNPDIRKGPWEPNEEELLNEWTVKLNFSWKEIQRRIPNRTDTQCRHQYFKALECSKINWSKEEDSRLFLAVTQLGKDWVKVAADLQRRTALQCRDRFEHLEKFKESNGKNAKSDHHYTESAPEQQTAS